MERTNRVAIIAGSTGLTGSRLVKKLIEGSEFSKIKVITRRPLTFNDSRIETILIKDLQEIHKEDPRFQADVYFCCLGTTIKKAGSQKEFCKVDLEAVTAFGEAAKANGAQVFVMISAMGANPQSLLFYNRVKGLAEQAILKLEIPGTVIFRPSLLIGNRLEERLAEKLSIGFVELISPMFPLSFQKKIGTKVEDLALIMLKKTSQTIRGPEIIEASQI